MSKFFIEMNRRAVLNKGVAAIAVFASGGGSQAADQLNSADPEDYEGVRWVRLANGHKVWTRRVGSGPRKLLVLHGGPGMSHDYLECLADFLPPAGYELYFYDQLGCGRSDRPDDTSLWTAVRYRNEVEEVRQVLGLDRFILYGHSWGGILGIEYALRYQRHLAAFVLSNMTASFADYGAYAAKLRALLPQEVRRRLDELETAGEASGPEFNELIEKELYTRYVCRLDPWPEPLQRTLKGINPVIYHEMQGANEFAMTGNLRTWDRWSDLPRINVPTLVMGARFDEMDPASIRRESELIPNSQLFISPSGSHLSLWDDQQRYFAALLGFLDGLDRRAFE